MNLGESAARLLGTELLRQQRVSGGDLSEVVGIVLADGREAIVKSGPAPRVEAGMLERIAATGAPAPAVLGVNESVLVLERLPSDGRADLAWRDLGGVLRTLHAGRSGAYGWDTDYAFGKVAILNAWQDDWPSFWAERRLASQVTYLGTDLSRRILTLASDLPNRLPKRPRPALLHGDLWSGNLLVSGDRISGLIDPACYYGDPEVDFAMLNLFGRPGGDLAAEYGPLEPGYEERRHVYQLWPAIVHLRLFGAGYRSLVDGLLGALGV